MSWPGRTPREGRKPASSRRDKVILFSRSRSGRKCGRRQCCDPGDWMIVDFPEDGVEIVPRIELMDTTVPDVVGHRK